MGTAQGVTNNISKSWGEEFKVNKSSKFQGLIGNDETGYYALRYTKSRVASLRKIMLRRFDNDLRFKKEAELLEGREKNVYFRGIELINHALFLFSEEKDPRTQQKTLFVQQIDKKALRPTGKKVEIASTHYEKEKGTSKWGYEEFSNTFFTAFSKNEKYILIGIASSDLGSNEKFQLMVVDSKWSKKWSREVELPYASELFNIVSYKVDNNGNVYVSGIVCNEKFPTEGPFVLQKRSLRGSDRTYTRHVIGFFNNGKKTKDYEIAPEGKYINDLDYAIANNGDLICTGFYSENSSHSIKGVYYLRINGTTKRVEKKSFEAFGDAFIMQGWSDKAVKKAIKKASKKKGKGIEMQNYDLKNIILREDGGMVLVAEQHYVEISTSTSSNANGGSSTSSSRHYYYNTILVVSVHPSGTIDWMKKIPKRHYSVNDKGYFSSFTTAVAGDKIYFVFNDNLKNMDPNKKEGQTYVFKNKQSGICVVVTMDSNGEFVKESLFKTQKENYILAVPKLSYQNDRKEMVVFCKKSAFGRAEKFMRLSFE